MKKYPGRKAIPYKPRKYAANRKSCKRVIIRWMQSAEGRQAKMLAHKFYEHLIGESVMENQRQFGNSACVLAIKAAAYHIPTFRLWYIEEAEGEDCFDMNPVRKIPCGAYRLYQRTYQAFRSQKDKSPTGGHLSRSSEHYLNPKHETTLRVWAGWATQVVETWAVNEKYGRVIRPYESLDPKTSRPIAQSVKRRNPDLPV